MFIFPLGAQADCSYERQAELSRVASNVQFSYSYEMVDKNPIFTVNITNITNDIYIVDNYGRSYRGEGEKNAIYQSGDEITFTIFSNDSNCGNYSILKQYLTIPNYNSYSLDPICKEIPNFKYCSMWLDNEGINYDTFASEADKYKAEKNANNNEENEEQVTWPEALLDAFLDHIYIPIIFVGLIVLIVIYRRMKNK